MTDPWGEDLAFRSGWRAAKSYADFLAEHGNKPDWIHAENTAFGNYHRKASRMTEKPIHTNAGPFDRKRLKVLRDTLKDQDRDAVVMFEGQELLVSYGTYLAEYVEMELGKRNTEGL